MKLKMYKVDIETFIYVLAEDKASAESLAKHEAESSNSELLEGCKCYASMVEKAKDVDSWFIDELPCISGKDLENPDNNGVDDVSCRTFFDFVKECEEKQKIEDQKKADREYVESLQIKFPFISSTGEVKVS